MGGLRMIINSICGLILGLAALVVTSSFAQAGGDTTAGRTVMVRCQSCHGKDGLGRAMPVGGEAPNIAGQKYDYLVHSLMVAPLRRQASKNGQASASTTPAARVKASLAMTSSTIDGPHHVAPSKSHL
jgi:cytochrome c553